jgi:hypothetical protein
MSTLLAARHRLRDLSTRVTGASHGFNVPRAEPDKNVAGGHVQDNYVAQNGVIRRSLAWEGGGPQRAAPVFDP